MKVSDPLFGALSSESSIINSTQSKKKKKKKKKKEKKERLKHHFCDFCVDLHHENIVQK